MPAGDALIIDPGVVGKVAEFLHDVLDHFDQIVSIRARGFGDCADAAFPGASCAFPGVRPGERYFESQRTCERRFRAIWFQDRLPGGTGNASGMVEVSPGGGLPPLLTGGFRGNEGVEKFDH